MTTMTNAKKVFAETRELCPGMSEDMYLLTDYISETFEDEIIPEEMLFNLFLIQYNLKNQEDIYNDCYPEQILARRKFLIKEIEWFPQVVDILANEEFVEEFRGIWKNFFGIVPPKRINIWSVKTEKEYPSNIRVAVEWWANAIVSPRVEANEIFSNFLNFLKICVTKEYTYEEIKIFKDTLARGIERSVKKYGKCNLDVGYYPCRILDEAGNKIGVKKISGYPCHTSMVVSENSVTLCDSKGVPVKFLWKYSEI